MPHIVFGSDDPRKEKIWSDAYQRRDEISKLRAHDAIRQAINLIDPTLTESEGLIKMIDAVVNYDFGGMDLFPKFKRDPYFEVKMSFSDFRGSSWQSGVAKCYLWLIELKKAKEEIAQIQ